MSGSLRARRVDAVLIAGPTASGKSALALRLAARLDGTIVNADSMQVYLDLRILTARPTTDDEAQVPHALYGTIDGAEAYAVNRWLDDAATAMATARKAGRLPIVVGGTGLYFKALVDGLSAIPPVPEPVRAEVRAMASTHAPAELHALLAARDPAGAARLRPTDPQRISRALEVHLATGRSLAEYQRTREPPTVSIDRCVAVRLEIDRAALRERIDRRFERMVEDGALAEVATLADRRLDPSLPVMRSIGVPALLRHLDGEVDLAGAIVAGQTASRQYLKRQETFARHQLQGFRPIDPDRAEAFVLDQFA